MHLRYFFLALTILYVPGFACGEVTPIIPDSPIHEAYVTPFIPIHDPIVATKKPPSEKVQNIPPKPFEDAIWITGYWIWIPETKEYNWICGVWRRPPPDHIWIDGSWIKFNGGWVWQQGFWSPIPENKLSYISEPPPKKISDNPTSAPNKDSFWGLGYWSYNPKTKSYGWVEGSWQTYDPNWVMSPGSYFWREKGYVFVDHYWDFPIDKRGVVFTCTYPVKQVTTDTLIESCYANYPDYSSWYHHWWHFHRSWWDNCWCILPWWDWSDWWTLSWHEQWALWWWYSHPDFPQPTWMTAETSEKITPPNENIIDFMKSAISPEFLQKISLTKNALKPTGKARIKNLKRPAIQNGVTSVGKINPPSSVPSDAVITPKPLVEPVPALTIDLKNTDEPSLTPLLDSDRPNYSQYEPLYEYRYQPEYKYQPEYYYKSYKEDTYVPSGTGEQRKTQ